MIKINVHSSLFIKMLIMVSCIFSSSPSMSELHSISWSQVVSILIRCSGMGSRVEDRRWQWVDGVLFRRVLKGYRLL
jgi:hypothetical protein